MRHLLSSLIVLASMASANVVGAGRIVTRPAQTMAITGGSSAVTFDPNSSIMRPTENRTQYFNRSMQPTLLRRETGALRRSSRPVDQMPHVESKVQLPVSSTRLMGSSSAAVQLPQSALFRPASATGKLQRCR